MSPGSNFGFHRPSAGSFLAGIMVMFLLFSGCTRIAGNYPPTVGRSTRISARFFGEGFQLLAGSRLPLEQVEAELGQLKSQGFSRRDPQIIRSVAKRKNIPPALLADRSGNAYYRFTAYLDPGTTLTLAPGALEVTLQTNGKNNIVRDRGFLLEDRDHPGGCRPPLQAALVLQAAETKIPVRKDFLVRLPTRGEIVGLELAPLRCDVARSPAVW